MIRAYHIDLGQRDVRIGMYDAFEFDPGGIPRYPYNGELKYNPTFIAHFGLYELGLYLRTGDVERRARFMVAADWFMDHGIRSSRGLVFPYEIPMPGLPIPWVSALGQGRAMSVLARAFEATQEERYLEAAFDAARAFRASVRDGGVVAQFPDGGIAFEEYPRTTPDIVLNGLISSLFGLFDVVTTADVLAHQPSPGPKPETSPDFGTRKRELDALFVQAVDSLAANLFRYDLRYWSAYDLSGRVASDEYHAYHVMLLWALYELTGIDEFADAAARWDRMRKGLRLFIGRNYSRAKSRLFQRSLYR